jgi:hypothetical protein
MRTVIVCNIASVDGYYADLTNPLALNMDEAFDVYNLERIAAADVVLLGRESFLGFSSYWPHVADAPDDPGNRAVDATNRQISRIYNGVPKVVISDSLVVAQGTRGATTLPSWRARTPRQRSRASRVGVTVTCWSLRATRCGTRCCARASWTSCTS